MKPSYDQKTFPERERANTLKLVASRDGRQKSISIHQYANLRARVLSPEHRLAWRNPEGRHVWLQVARGRLTVNGVEIGAGDAVWTSDPGDLLLAAKAHSELLLFDLAWR